MCRILAIAPYESMRNLIVNLCADRPEIQLTALVGDLEEGAKLVQTIPSEDYDIPICRYATQEEFVYLRLPPLRDRIHEIPALATLYTSEFNTQLSKQVIGFLPEALDVLMGYSWPGNLNQFRRIVKELILQTAGPYITADMVRNLLRQEGAGTFSASPAESINIDQPLDDIIYDVVCRQLAQSKQNQTKVAEKLGISRTTLWRILQRKRKDS